MNILNAVGQPYIEIFLDDETKPIVAHKPPARFELDTTRLVDGSHTLHVKAYDSSGQQGTRSIPFTVRNGPGIAVNGLRDEDILEGKLPILVNAYGGTSEENWEPSRVETPAPIPTLLWVLFIVIVAFGVFYGVSHWSPPKEFSDTSTYENTTINKSAVNAYVAIHK